MRRSFSTFRDMPKAKKKKADGNTVASVERALDVLDAFGSSPAPLTLADLSARTGLYKSTILRLAQTLEGYGYLVRATDGTYQIGPKPFLLGAHYQSSVIPVEWVVPVLREMVSATGESASFNVRQGDLRVCLVRVDSPHLLRDHTQPGDVRPLGVGAAGQILLAFARPDDPKYKDVRRGLISRSYGEIEPDMAGIAVPVFGPDSQLRGALALSGPRSRFTNATITAIERALWQAATKLTNRIGGDSEPLVAAAAGKAVESATSP